MVAHFDLSYFFKAFSFILWIISEYSELLCDLLIILNKIHGTQRCVKFCTFGGASIKPNSFGIMKCISWSQVSSLYKGTRVVHFVQRNFLPKDFLNKVFIWFFSFV